MIVWESCFTLLLLAARIAIAKEGLLKNRFRNEISTVESVSTWTSKWSQTASSNWSGSSLKFSLTIFKMNLCFFGLGTTKLHSFLASGSGQSQREWILISWLHLQSCHDNVSRLVVIWKSLRFSAVHLLRSRYHLRF